MGLRVKQGCLSVSVNIPVAFVGNPNFSELASDLNFPTEIEAGTEEI